MIGLPAAKGLLCLLFALGLSTTGVVGLPGYLVPDVTVEPGLIAQDNSLALADQLQAIMDDPDYEGDLERMFEVGRTALANREGLVGDLLPDEMAPLLQKQHQNLDAAQDLLAMNEAEHESDLHRAIALAQQGTKWQAATLGLDWIDPVPLTGPGEPSQALLELASRYNVEPTPAQLEEIRTLDQQPQPLQDALTRFVEAFLALETASRLAYEQADLAILDARLDEIAHDREARWHPEAMADVISLPGEQLAEAGIDLTLVLAMRNQLLDAVLDLYEALETVGVVAAQSCNPIQLVPAFSIDVAGCDNTYTQDVALSLDVDGQDTYHNNAGGGNLADGSCTQVINTGVIQSAALVDLGADDDRYGDPVDRRSCGANGGGYLGVGFLLDQGGDDAYTAASDGTNGGGFGGVGFLLDQGGSDTYSAGATANGGGFAGAGFLLDQGGDDVYSATGFGTNGGGFAGAGFLLNQGGSDTYSARGFGTNGGSSTGGVGFLLDQGGNDTYTATTEGTNGGSSIGGVGFLLDQGGSNTYTATGIGTNGGGVAGVGFLVDQGGSDTYSATRFGTNGGSAVGGVGFLLDQGGDDTYTAGDCGANGAGAKATCDILDLGKGVGHLHDLGGTDRYADPAIPGGSCWDCTIVVKGNGGSQVDTGVPP